MTLQFQCKGCNHERTEPESEHARKGFCASCDAKGVGLNQIKKVEKWEARDGSFHDTLEAAQRHQLMSELKQALQACQSRPEDQAQHLLCHFDIVRKGDAPKVIYRAVPAAQRGHPKFYSFFWGCVLTATLGTVFLHFAN